MLTRFLSSVPYRRKVVRCPKDSMTRTFVLLEAPDFSRVRVHNGLCDNQVIIKKVWKNIMFPNLFCVLDFGFLQVKAIKTIAVFI